MKCQRCGSPLTDVQPTLSPAFVQGRCWKHGVQTLPAPHPSDTLDGRAGETAKERAVERAVAAADPEWSDAAFAAIVAVARQEPAFTTDAVWAELDRLGIPRPREPRAIAGPVRRAISAHVIKWSGRPPEPTARPEAHRNPKRVYHSMLLG